VVDFSFDDVDIENEAWTFLWYDANNTYDHGVSALEREGNM